MSARTGKRTKKLDQLGAVGKVHRNVFHANVPFLELMIDPLEE